MEISRVTPSISRACLRRFLPRHSLHLRGLQTHGFQAPYGRRDDRRRASQDGRGGRDAFQYDASKSRARAHDNPRPNQSSYDAKTSRRQEDNNSRPPRSFQSKSPRLPNEDGVQRTSRSDSSFSSPRREEETGQRIPATRRPPKPGQPTVASHNRYGNSGNKTKPRDDIDNDAKSRYEGELIPPEIYEKPAPRQEKWKDRVWDPHPKGSTDEMSDLIQSYPQGKTHPSSRQVAQAAKFFEATKSPMLYSVKLLEDFPDSDLPEVLFVGCNKAGKSTLLNTLLRCTFTERVVPTLKYARPAKTNTFDGYLVTDDEALSAAVQEAGPKKSDEKVAEGASDDVPLEAEETELVEEKSADSPRDAEETASMEEGSADSLRQAEPTKPIKEASEDLPQTTTNLRLNEAPQARPRGFVVIDSAGYGHGFRPSFGEEIQKVIENRRQLRHVFVVTDPHHGLKKTDLRILLWLRKMNLPHTLMLGKIDKVTSKNNYWSGKKKARAVMRAMEMIEKRREELDALAKDGREFDVQILCASGEHSFVRNKGAGVERLKQAIFEVCGMETHPPGMGEKKALMAKDLASASLSPNVTRVDGQAQNANSGVKKHADTTTVEVEAVEASGSIGVRLEPDTGAERAHEAIEEDAKNKEHSKDANVE